MIGEKAGDVDLGLGLVGIDLIPLICVFGLKGRWMILAVMTAALSKDVLALSW